MGNETMVNIESLMQRLDQLDREIAETKKRLPAHSVKPPVMMDLMALEDEYDEVLKQIEQLKKQGEKPV
jgi:prefoldin subunit 5